MQEKQNREEIIASLDTMKRELTEISDDIWSHPELAFEEIYSSEKLKTYLKSKGFRITCPVAGLATAFLAEFGEGKPVVGFLGEYDALPDLSQEAGCWVRKPLEDHGPGHGCGHHILGTAAMGAAVAAAQYKEAHHLPGTIRFYGCPAEEGGSGKSIMALDGVFDDTDAAITWHAADDNNIWSMNFLATVHCKFVFHGIGAHAASQGHIGRSALEGVEIMNTGANYLRGHVTRDVCINYAVPDAGGSAANNFPVRAEVIYLLRANTQERAAATYRRLVEIAKGAAMITGTQVDCEFISGTSELIPNRTLEKLMYEKFLEVGPVPITEEDREMAAEIRKTFPEGAEESTFSILRMLYGETAEEIIPQIRGKWINDIIYPYTPISIAKYGSTDVCDVSFFTPVAQVTTACYAKDTPGHSWQETAQGKTNLCHNGMLTAAKIMALTAAELLETPETLAAIRAEFQEKTKGKTYLKTSDIIQSPP